MIQQPQRNKLTQGNYAPAIAPPPPVPPPTPAPTFAPPPNAIGEDAGLDESRELMGLIEPQPVNNQTPQTQTTARQTQTLGNTAPSNPALTPNPDPGTQTPPPTQTPVAEPYDTGTEAYPGANARYAEWAAANPTLAAGSDPAAYTAPGPESFVGPSKEQVHYIGNTGQTMTQAQYDQHIASGGHWTPPESELGPAQTSVPAGTIEITPEMIEENRAYWIAVNAQNQGRPATQEQIDAAPHTPPGTTFPHQNAPHNQYLGGPEQQYGPGTMGPNGVLPDSYGYIGEDDPQRELLDMLDSGMGGYGGDQGQILGGFPIPPVNQPLVDYTDDGGFTSQDPVVPPAGGTQAPADEDPAAGYDAPEQPEFPDIDVGEDEATSELRDLIRDRAESGPGGGEDDDSSDLMALFDEGADAIRARTERNRKDGLINIEEAMSRRGTVGGSPEFSEIGDLEERLFLAEQEGLSELNRERMGFGLQERALDLQKYGIDANLAYNYAALEQDAGFRTTAQELQKLGMQMDEAYRYAAMAQDGNFQQQALNLQEKGMRMDEAYRYAELSQDARFRQLATDLQRRGLDIQEAYQQAALQWDKEKYGQQHGLEKEGLELERQRLRAQIIAGLLAGDIDIGDLSDEEKEALGIPPGTDTKSLTPEQRRALLERISKGLFGG